MKVTALWTNHALQRASEYGFTPKILLDSWFNSLEQPLSAKQQIYKFKKYGMKSLSDKFFWHPENQIMFTVSVAKSGQWFIQTVTKGRGSWIK